MRETSQAREEVSEPAAWAAYGVHTPIWAIGAAPTLDRRGRGEATALSGRLAWSHLATTFSCSLLRSCSAVWYSASLCASLDAPQPILPLRVRARERSVGRRRGSLKSREKRWQRPQPRDRARRGGRDWRKAASTACGSVGYLEAIALMTSSETLRGRRRLHTPNAAISHLELCSRKASHPAPCRTSLFPFFSAEYSTAHGIRIILPPACCSFSLETGYSYCGGARLRERRRLIFAWRSSSISLCDVWLQREERGMRVGVAREVATSIY